MVHLRNRAEEADGRPGTKAAKEGGKRMRPCMTVECGKILVTVDKDAVGQGGERGEERGEV